MKLTYERMFGCDDTYNDVHEKSGISEQPTDDDIRFAGSIVEGVQANIEEIDAVIAEAAVGWTVERMPRVDLSILRNAVYEIRFSCEVPPAVAVNEAVELAKKYEGPECGAFVNGILGSLIRSLPRDGGE